MRSSPNAASPPGTTSPISNSPGRMSPAPLSMSSASDRLNASSSSSFASNVLVVGLDDRTVDVNRFRLADAIGAVGCLVFLGRVPGAGVVNDVIGALDVHAEADRNRRQNDNAEPGLLLERLEALQAAVAAPLCRRGLAVDDVRGEAENLLDVVAQQSLDDAELAEDDCLFALRADVLKRAQ